MEVEKSQLFMILQYNLENARLSSLTGALSIALNK